MKINSLSVPKRSVYGAEHYLSCTSCLKPPINFVALTPSQSFFLRIAIVPKTPKPNGIFFVVLQFPSPETLHIKVLCPTKLLRTQLWPLLRKQAVLLAARTKHLQAALRGTQIKVSTDFSTEIQEICHPPLPPRTVSV